MQEAVKTALLIVVENPKLCAIAVVEIMVFEGSKTRCLYAAEAAEGKVGEKQEPEKTMMAKLRWGED